MSYPWVWSPLSNYSTSELEEHKLYLKKVIEFQRSLELRPTNAWHDNEEGLHLIWKLGQHIRDIDEEIERRESNRLLLKNSSFLLLENGSRLQLEGQVTESFEPDTMNELAMKDKQITILRRCIERLIREMAHERLHLNRLQRIIDWFNGINGSFYKSDVEKDE